MLYDQPSSDLLSITVHSSTMTDKPVEIALRSHFQPETIVEPQLTCAVGG